MARYTESVCRLCRREGMKLFLKGDRCFKDKCAIERRNYPPGQHGRRRSKLLGYGIQLREKQKVKRIYGLLERPFRLTFQRAERRKGITGANLLQELERRLDNVAFSLGFAASRAQARQLVCHGHVTVNGRKVTIPSFRVSKGNVVAIKAKSRSNEQIKASVETARARGVPGWLDLQPESFSGTVLELPSREEIKLPIQEQLIVELYSK
ncbi:MAG TPA: 30S ribosomal protein S4 [Thermoanaerobaculia bacterium]